MKPIAKYHVSAKPRTCEMCQKKFPAGKMYVELVAFVRAKLIRAVVCTSCNDDIGEIPAHISTMCETLDDLFNAALCERNERIRYFNIDSKIDEMKDERRR